MTEPELRRRDAIMAVGATGDRFDRMAFALNYYADAGAEDLQLDGSRQKNVAAFAIACVREDADAAEGLYDEVVDSDGLTPAQRAALDHCAAQQAAGIGSRHTAALTYTDEEREHFNRTGRWPDAVVQRRLDALAADEREAAGP